VVVTATGSGTATVNCPAGHPNALGGGFLTTTAGNNHEVRISQPVGGSTTTPATGWTATLQAGDTSSITVYAICSA
jgi:hypothetical protein